MQNELINERDFPPLTKAELSQIQGGFSGPDQPVHLLPIHLPEPPGKSPINVPVILPIMQPIRKKLMPLN